MSKIIVEERDGIVLLERLRMGLSRKMLRILAARTSRVGDTA